VRLSGEGKALRAEMARIFGRHCDGLRHSAGSIPWPA
jgi:hypothetical protein